MIEQIFSRNVEAIKAGLRQDYFHLIIFPTEQCNFRCTYCYEQFDIGRMSTATRNAVCKLLAQRPDLKALRISWFGGEPLAAFNVVKHVGAFAHRFCRQHEIALHGDMTTNGFLLDEEKTPFLLDHGITNFQISLDGDQDIHDTTRIQASGNGSFARIFNNLKAMTQTDRAFNLTLRIHYHKGNIASVLQLIDRLANTFGCDERVQLFFHSVNALGGPNDQTFPFVEETDRRGIEAQFHDYVGGRLSVTRNDHESYVCYACKGNSIAIRANGTISKCTVALYDDRNIIGRLDTDGRLIIDNDKFRAWISPLLSGSNAERACPAPSVLEAH